MYIHAAVITIIHRFRLIFLDMEQKGQTLGRGGLRGNKMLVHAGSSNTFFED